MKDMNFSRIIERSMVIRESYHKLEDQYHGEKWSVEEDELFYFD